MSLPHNTPPRKGQKFEWWLGHVWIFMQEHEHDFEFINALGEYTLFSKKTFNYAFDNEIIKPIT